MRFAVISGERSVEELVERLYRTESKSAASRAKRGLRDLNPQLKEITDVAEGTAIIVPDVEGAEPVGEEEIPRARALSKAVLDDFDAAMDAALEHLERSIAEERDEVRHTVKLLRSGEVRAAAKDVPEAPAQLEATLAGVEERRDEIEALDLYRRRVLVPVAGGPSRRRGSTAEEQGGGSAE